MNMGGLVDLPRVSFLELTDCALACAREPFVRSAVSQKEFNARLSSSFFLYVSLLTFPWRAVLGSPWCWSFSDLILFLAARGATGQPRDTILRIFLAVI
jgi:hypothetical protein